MSNETWGRRPTWAEVNLDALAANYQIVRSQVASDVSVMTVVKANAYGHGAMECAQRLAREGADWFGVAMPEEGINLRQAGIRQPVLCLGGFWDGQAEACIKYDLVPVIYRLDMAVSLDRAARAAGVVRDVHVKIDTGMGRLGVRCDAAREFAARLADLKNICID
ncbi:MAG: alanine racemase, partial [Acidobacteriota bacterium]|nr:alanine racemase [Acidobacteriota bacterium]